MTTSTDPNRKQLIDEFHRLQKALHSARMKGAGLFIDVDLTLPQLKLLFAIGHDESLTMGEISNEMGVTLSACTHLVDKLVKSRLVERYNDEADRRVVRCSITDEAQSLIGRLRESASFMREEFVDRMTDDELKTVVEGMVIVDRVMHEMQEEAAQ